jgi:hypothetical protein
MSTTKQAPDFANLTVEEVETLFEGTGRNAAVIPETIVELVKRSYNAGQPKAFKVKNATPESAALFKRLLQKAGHRHTPELTVRCRIESDGVTVRFKAGPKVTRRA